MPSQSQNAGVRSALAEQQQPTPGGMTASRIAEQHSSTAIRNPELPRETVERVETSTQSGKVTLPNVFKYSGTLAAIGMAGLSIRGAVLMSLDAPSQVAFNMSSSYASSKIFQALNNPSQSMELLSGAVASAAIGYVLDGIAKCWLTRTGPATLARSALTTVGGLLGTTALAGSVLTCAAGSPIVGIATGLAAVGYLLHQPFKYAKPTATT